jgi:pimeloyl-ACP methyl ester carboxylesterase
LRFTRGAPPPPADRNAEQTVLIGELQRMLAVSCTAHICVRTREALHVYLQELARSVAFFLCAVLHLLLSSSNLMRAPVPHRKRLEIRMLTWRSLAVLCLTVSLGGAGAGCAAQGNPEPRALVVDKKVAALVKHACEDDVDSVYQNPGSLSGLDDNRRGDIVRCAKGDAISVESLQKALSEAGFYGVEVKSSVQLYRVMYRTTRAFGGADVSSALVVVPNETDDEGDYDEAKGVKVAALRAKEDDDDQGGKRGPLVVYGHGTSPYGQACGVSRADPLTATFLDGPDRELRTLLALAAQGWPVIAPDYAGFVEGSPVTGYMFAEDEAYSVLDATRAMKKLLEKFPDQSVLVGHSQGGHAVLAAQSYEKKYGADGKIAGVVAFAPFWAPARAFGVILSSESDYKTDDPTGVGGYAINTAVEYFYSHEELIAGSGRDILSFNIDDLLGPECNYFPDLTPYGTYGTDLFKEGFEAVAACAAAGVLCDDPLAQTWSERFKKDRPALDPKGAPVLLWQGAEDEVVPVSIVGCGVDKIRQDFSSANNASATLELCADPSAEHELVESNNAAHAIQWIKARTHGSEEPTQPCGDETVLEGIDCFIGNHD